MCLQGHIVSTTVYGLLSQGRNRFKAPLQFGMLPKT